MCAAGFPSRLYDGQRPEVDFSSGSICTTPPIQLPTSSVSSQDRSLKAIVLHVEKKSKNSISRSFVCTNSIGSLPNGCALLLAYLRSSPRIVNDYFAVEDDFSQEPARCADLGGKNGNRDFISRLEC